MPFSIAYNLSNSRIPLEGSSQHEVYGVWRSSWREKKKESSIENPWNFITSTLVSECIVQNFPHHLSFTTFNFNLYVLWWKWERMRLTLLLGSRINTRISSNNSTCARKIPKLRRKREIVYIFFNCRRYFVAEILFLNDIISEQTARQRDLIRWQQSQSLQETYEQDDHVAGWCIHMRSNFDETFSLYSGFSHSSTSKQQFNCWEISYHLDFTHAKLWSRMIWYSFSTHNNMRVSYTHNNDHRRNWKYFTYSFRFRPSSIWHLIMFIHAPHL